MLDDQSHRRAGSGARAATLTLLLAAFALTGCSDDAPGITIPRPDRTALPETGRGLYLRECAGCHGLGGEPAGNGISDLRDYQGTSEHFDSVLTLGPGLMPRYPGLDRGQRLLIHDHIRTFRR